MAANRFELTLTGMGHKGEAFGPGPDGKLVFVAYGLPGERVLLARGKTGLALEAVLAPSTDRVTAPCPAFGQCGGCLLQHWAAAPYRTFKRELVVQALVKAGLGNRSDIEKLTAPLVDAWGAGRRRATLHGTRQAVGFAARGSNDVVPIEQCPILVPELDRAVEITEAIVNAVGNVDVALTLTDNGLDVHVTGTCKDPYGPLSALARKLDLARIAFNGEPVLVRRPAQVQMGRGRVDLPVGSFLQATHAAEEALAALVVGALGKAKNVADLFCGVGPFALRIAETAKVYAADSDAAAVASAQAALTGTPGLRVLGTEVRDLMARPLLPAELERFDAVVFDPPRAGAVAQATELARSKVPLVVAVSCDPATMGRDLKILVDGGYTLERVTPLDQFAYSPHVEAVAVLRRTGVLKRPRRFGQKS